MATFTKAEIRALDPCYPWSPGLLDKYPEDSATAAEIKAYVEGLGKASVLPWLMAGSVALAADFGPMIGWNASGDRGRTALHYAAYYKRPSVITYLLSQGSSKAVMDDKGLTPVQVAAMTQDAATIAAMGA